MGNKFGGVWVVEVDRLRQLYPTVDGILYVKLKVSFFFGVTLLPLPVWDQ